MTKTVLIVEDEQEILECYREKFREYATIFSILTAADGTEAAEKLREYDVSLVVTDLNMPGMNGFELMDYIREHHPGTPVIVTSGFSEDDAGPLARTKGAMAYFHKPVMLEELAHAVIHALTGESSRS